MNENIYNLVQAVLLNGECDPAAALRAALVAAFEFGMTECDASHEFITDCAYAEAEQRVSAL